MTDFREIRNLPPLRPILETREDVQLAIQELSVALSEFAGQWNDSLYPLLGSLPGGRVRRAAQDRGLDIQPIDNGFDGSQVFMDQTARPGDLGGVLHTGLRPKTIKEVILQTTQALGGRLNRVERLLEDLEVGNSATYDDAQLRNWLLRLTAETWDPDGIAQGAIVNTGNFAGAPVKSSEYSLAQKNINLRHLLGIEALSQGLRDLTEVTGISGTNYISTDEDIIAALITLDSEISSISIGSTDLQQAYNNTASGKEIDVASNPIHILSSGSGTEALQLTGDLTLNGELDSSPTPLITLGTASTGNLAVGNWKLNLKTGGVDPLATFEERRGSGTTNLTTLTLGETSAAILTLGGAYGDSSSMSLLNSPGTSTAEFNSKLGLEINISNGDLEIHTGADDLIWDGTDAVFNPTNAFLVLSAVSVGIDALGTSSLHGQNLQLGSVADTEIEAGNDLTIDATHALSLNGDVLVGVTSSGTISLNSGDELNLTGANGVNISGEAVSITSDTFDITITSAQDVVVGATRNVAIDGVDITLDATDDLFLLADGDLVISSDNRWSLAFTEGAGSFLHGTEAAFAQGFKLEAVTSIDSDGSPTGSTASATINFAETGYSDAPRASVSADAPGMRVRAASFRSEAYAPTKKGGVSYGGAFLSLGKPVLNEIYRENILKAKGKFAYNGSSVINGTEAILDEADFLDSYNIFILDSDAAPFEASTQGLNKVNIKFITAMPTDHYSVSLTVESKAGYLSSIQIVEGSQNEDGFSFEVYSWQVGVSTDWQILSQSAKVSFQVV